jgi:hypothetical protein
LTLLSRRLAAALPVIEAAPDSYYALVGTRKVSAAEPVSFRRELTGAIYDELHAGRQAPGPALGQDLRDPELEERFRELMPSPEITRTVPVVAADPGEAVVRLDGVNVRVPRASVVGDDEPRPGSMTAVRIPAGRPGLSPGYFLADCGAESGRAEQARGAVLRVYVHLQTAAAALDAWSAVLGVMARLGCGFQAKVASWPPMLPRRDGLVLYLDGYDPDVIRQVASAAGQVPGVGRPVSVFAEPVGPGVAIAWEPSDPRPAMRGFSFGEHRAAALAEGLVQHAMKIAVGEQSDVSAAVAQALIEAGVDPADPARNR